MDGAEIEEVYEESQDLKPAAHFEVSTSSEVRAEDEVLSYPHEIPPPDDGFLHVCAAIDPNMPDDLKDNVWAQVCMMLEKVDLDDETIAYVACAFYCVMLEMEKFQQKPFSYSMLTILKICSVSVIEFFDKLSRWVQIATSSKKIIDQSHKIESSLSVSFVIFKKLLPIFRSLFQFVGSDSDSSFDSNDLFATIWLMTIIMKKSLPAEDLITSFHLLLCVVEWVYKDLCFHGCEEHIEPESVNTMMESKDGVRVLEVLCRSFDGVLLDAKHFRTHWFNQKRETILPCLDHKDLNIAANHKQYLTSLNSIYQDIMLRKGELDERMFLPEDAANVFDAALDSSAIELLRRGSTDSRFADAELLLTMSTQNCLERLAEVKRSPVRSDAKSYVISSQQLRPLGPITQIDASATSLQRLNPIVPSDYKLEGSALQRYCLQTKDNPLSVLELNSYMLGERFVERVAAECSDREELYDPSISHSPDEHRKAMTMLFYVLVEHIVLGERKQNPERDFQGLLRKEEFLSAVFCCAMELVLFVQESERAFPWCLEVCGLPAISFQKIIEVVIRNETQLTREMARHLNKLEERVLEELAWTHGSPLWTMLSRKPNSVPTCEEAWGNPKTTLVVSPNKRMRYEVDSNNMPQKRLPPCSAQMSFFSKLYYLASLRLTDICERIRVDDRGRRMMWTLLEYILKEERSLFTDRHLDQNLLCIVYVVCKANKADVSFVDIMSHYRNQPQARSHIYRSVRVDSSICPSNGTSRREGVSSGDSSAASSQQLRSHSAVGPSPEKPVSLDGSVPIAVPTTPEPQSTASGHHVDLIVYYNKVFLPRVEEFMRDLSENSTLASLTPMPARRIPLGTPLKRSLSDKVTVVPYSQMSYMQRDTNTIRYRISQSPSRDFRAINRLLSKNRPLYRIAGAPEVNPPLGYRIVI
ncbi:Retinoblastoma-associated protein A domain protein [Trichostrongylus colubriformis]|uniref:Retinoblastoma-associated protein A domain protein n=1 Tax=Trichostrongylus colubriformis TaxID=6319 RepID=A0AAN8F216_TRICO